MIILALDLGKSKSVGCVYESREGEHRFRTVRTEAQALHDLILDVSPDRVVFEIGSSAGWITDLVRALEIELQVVNTAHQAWRWRNVKKKNDRVDALKLAQLSAANQLSVVHVPSRRVRQWRSLIAYRHQVVARRTAIKNSIRAILDREGLRMPAGNKGWSVASLERLHELARPLSEVDMDDLWRGQLWMELDALRLVQEALDTIEKQLDALAKSDTRCRLLMTTPGVGLRLAEAVTAVIDDPHRFRSGREVGSYVGLTPRQFQSGSSDRHGRISGAGHQRLRSLLVEVAWVGLRYNPWMREVYERVRRGSNARKKIAIVAVARRLLVRCWAILRDERPWREGPPSNVVASP